MSKRPLAPVGAFDAVGDTLTRAGAIDACGDRIPVPARVKCPRPEDSGGGATRLHPGDFPGKRSVYPIHLLRASTRAPMARLDEACETIAHHRPGCAG